METLHGRFLPDDADRGENGSRGGIPKRIVAGANPGPAAVATPPTQSTQQESATPAGEPPAEASGPPTAGERAERSNRSRYVALNELGRGGWGVVQRAIDRQLERDVAVKRILNAQQLRPGDVDQFLHEARITGGLQHPGIVPVHELVHDQEGDTYYVMKLLEGETLRHHIRRVHQQRGDGKWNRQDLIQAINPLLLRFIDVCNAIAYAHGRGIIHRDLKPSNVMAGAFGETIVVDWGLARYIDGAPTDETSTFQQPRPETPPARPTQATRDHRGSRHGSSTPRSSGPFESEGSVVGTPTYMAPEQARGELSSLGSHSDIYSLGVMLYEIVAGQHPHRGMDVQTVLDRARRGEHTPLATVQPETPKALAAIVHTAMSSDPKQRYGDVETLAEDVRRFMVGDSVSVYRESLLERGGRWCKRHRGIAGTLAIAGLALFAVTLVSAIVIHRAHAAEKRARLDADRAHREALHHLIEARETADTWLVDLSGALQFHPAMMPLRNELLSQARKRYEDLVRQPLVPIGSIHLDAADRSDHGSTDALMWLEHARCYLRLGDLHRLCEDAAAAEQHYAAAAKILARLHHPGAAVRRVGRSTHPAGDDWHRIEPGLEQLVQLEQINVAIGHALATQSPPSFGEILRIRERLDVCLPAVPIAELPGEISDDVGRLISTRVRFELAIARTTAADAATGQRLFSADRFDAAAAWARWLAHHRGRASDLQLCETVLTEQAQRREADGDPRGARDAWSNLIEELQRWIARSPDRSDWIASLAHARLCRGQAAAKLDQRDAAANDCVAAIEELRRSWALTDADAFYRVNLATARFNLARLWADGDAQQREQAQQLLAETIAIYRELLRESATPDVLRRLAQAHAATADSLATSTTEDPSGEPRPIDDHLRNAIVAYEILQDQGFLDDRDRLHLCGALIDVAGGNADSAEVSRARRVLDAVDPQQLPESLQRTYQSLRKTLGGSSTAGG